MSGQSELPRGAGAFLIVVGAAADVTKFGLDAIFGVGIVLDPLVISPVTTLIFWIVMNHYDVPMFSGRRAVAGWANLAIAETPGIDIFPDWTVYAAYLTFAPRAINAVKEIAG